MISDNLIKLLVEHEGYKGVGYDDATGEQVHAPVGNLTVGIGFNLEAGGLSLSECKTILAMRLSSIINELTNSLSFFGSLDEIRQAALIDLAYNMGVNGLLKFRNADKTGFLDLLSNHNYVEAAVDLSNTKWASQVQAARVDDICSMITTGVWPSSATRT